MIHEGAGLRPPRAHTRLLYASLWFSLRGYLGRKIRITKSGPIERRKRTRKGKPTRELPADL